MPRESLIISILILLLSTSCEGFKVLTIHNVSNSNARITLSPGIENSNQKWISNYPNDLSSYSSVIILEPDSSVKLLSIFTNLTFTGRLKARELRTDYLKIETSSDTIIANSKDEIIELLKDPRTKYSRKLDRELQLLNDKRWGNIMIR